MTHTRHTVIAVATLVAMCLLGGCGAGGIGGSSAASPPTGQIELITRVLDGTVGQLGYLEGGGTRIIRGYGLVVGLAGNGSSECPTEVRRRLVDDMARRGVGDARTGTAMISPNMLIDDDDTAVVIVSAVVPPGTPAGAPLDASVAALPNSQTMSLDGGMLYLTELRAFSTATGAVKESARLAEAAGPVFVNPFADDRDPTTTSRLRRGRVIGGCTVRKSREIRLVLRQPDHAMARVLQQAINDRFDDHPKVANAQSPSSIRILVPRRFLGDHNHFLELLTHLYIRRGGGIEDRKARELIENIMSPDAPHERISLMWEAMGRQVLPIIRRLFSSENTTAAFYAARAAARLGDRDAVDVLASLAVGDSPYRMAAIIELGRAGNVAAAETLGDLLSDSDARVRVAAYDAVSAARLGCGVKRYDVNGEFGLDVVPGSGEFMIYATRSGRPRVVLFGDGMAVRRPVFFTTPDDLVTINGDDAGEKVQVFRRVGARKRLSEVLKVDPDVRSIVLALGKPAEQNTDGTFEGLGLTYSQVVGVLYRLCEDKAGKKVPAVFVLQRPDETDRIVPGRMPPGRQDMSSRR